MTTDRRKFIKISAMSGLATIVSPALHAGIFSADGKHSDDKIPKPTFAQMEWQDAEMGVIFHFDISSGSKNVSANNNSRDVFDPKEYNPVALDTDQWVRAAKDAGATYAVFTATHFGGFLQWQSELYPYGLKQAKWRNGQGDIVADFVKSCYKYNIKPGLYLSTNRNAWWQVDKHFVDWGKGKGTSKQKAFNQVCEKMVEELCSRYGRLLEIWFDAGNVTPANGGPYVLPIFEKYQPNGLFYSSLRRSDFRWVGNEAGFADYPCWATMPSTSYSHNSSAWKEYLSTGYPEGGTWSPAMVDFPLRGANGVHDWFWYPKHQHGIYSVQHLMKIYRQSVGRNSNMLMGVVINPDGLVPDADYLRLKEFGNELKKQFNSPLKKAKGIGEKFTLKLRIPVALKQIVLQEDIQFGERVRSFTISGWNKNGKWVNLNQGSCIGHKRIIPIENTEKFEKIVLQIEKSTAQPHIRNFIVY